MVPPGSKQELRATAVHSSPSKSDSFAALHPLVSRIDTEGRVQELVEKAQDLDLEDSQLLVDCLSMAVEKNVVQSRNRIHVWHSLIKVAFSTKLLARNRTLNAEYVTSEGGISPAVYSILGETPTRIRVLRQLNTHTANAEGLVGWAHLSHQNILPLYAAFLEGEDYLSFVIPYDSCANIRDYTREHIDVPRVPMIFDVVNGLSYIHELNITHGGLIPENVLISDAGRALITGLDSTEKWNIDSVSPRYAAPELAGEDDIIWPTKATDMWSLACLCYEVLSGNVPYCQLSSDLKVVAAIARGTKPTRPGCSGITGDEVDETIWQLMLMCWEYEPEGRPTCLKVQQIFLGMDIKDTRSEAKPSVRPEATKCPSADLDPERTRTILMRMLSSDNPLPPRVPEYLRNMLERLVPDPTKFKVTAAAANKLSPDDTQHFVDFLELLFQDYPYLTDNPVNTLLSSIMMSTHTVPQCYKLNGVQYDPTPIAEGRFWKAYRGRGLNTRINVVTNTTFIGKLLKELPGGSHLSHPNISSFYGVFHEGPSEFPRFCFATPFWNHGNLRCYMSTLPQKLRQPLISDVINGLEYLHGKGVAFGKDTLTTKCVMVSESRRGILVLPEPHFTSTTLEVEPAATTYELHFSAPDVNYCGEDDIWSFGCLCYEVLSRKLPYYQYSEDAEIRSAVASGELPRRPSHTDDSADEIGDQAWELIIDCCAHWRWERPKAPEIRQIIEGWRIEDDHPEREQLISDADVLRMRSPRPDIKFHRVEELLKRMQAEFLRHPLIKLLQNHISDVVYATIGRTSEEIQVLVDFLDLALKDHLSISEERNRVLALLSRVTSSTSIFPQHYEIKGIKYHSAPIAEGGFGSVHRGVGSNVCVKVMAKVDPKALMPWIRELIIWAHSSHPNVLPFCGVLLEGSGDSRRISLISPFMKNGNLHDYAPYLPQKSRIPLILDVINGLYYLHGLGIIHSDLKGQNVLISNEGRGLITDFGASHIVTSTAAATGSPIFSTLRFTAPEIILGSTQLSTECDVWSFGCLCFEVLSLKVPYYQYNDVQVSAALIRKEPPKRPGSVVREINDSPSDDDWEDSDEEDPGDTLDDQAWILIAKCCAPEPGDRLTVPNIQELITDMKIWDDRPMIKAAPGTEVSGLRSNPIVDLNRVGELLDRVQAAVAPVELDDEFNFTELYNSL